MTAPRARTRRTPEEVTVWVTAVVTGAVLTCLGVVTALLTVLQAVYPCGETYQDGPSCGLADPGAIGLAYLLVIVVPAACAITGLVTFAALRRTTPPMVAVIVIELVAFVTGQLMLFTALADLVPR